MRHSDIVSDDIMDNKLFHGNCVPDLDTCIETASVCTNIDDTISLMMSIVWEDVLINTQTYAVTVKGSKQKYKFFQFILHEKIPWKNLVFTVHVLRIKHKNLTAKLWTNYHTFNRKGT